MAYCPVLSCAELAPCAQHDDKKACFKDIPPQWADKIERVLRSSSEIQARVKEMAQQISRDYGDEKLLCVGLLTGGFPLCSDLLRYLRIPYEIDFIAVGSYGTNSLPGEVKLKKDMSIDPTGRHVLIIEDLIDTGTTLAWIENNFKTRNCASVKMCCLLDKKARRKVPVKIDYLGWECEDEFLVGYGMDFANTYRCLPFVGVLKRSAYA